MARKTLEWLCVALLIILIVIGARVAWSQYVGQPATALGTVESGSITELPQIVVAEQVNTFAEFAEFENKTLAAKFVRWIPGLADVGKATVYFKWEARVLYGVKVSRDDQIKWRRLEARPGVIEILSPPLAVLENKIELSAEKLVARTVNESRIVNSQARALDYLGTLQEKSDLQAQAGLQNATLKKVAESVIAGLIISIVNQSASEKINDAVVKFDPG